MKKILLFTFLLTTFGSFAQSSADSIPDWVNNPPKSKKFFYSVGVGKSAMIDVAERKAILDANIKLAEMVEPAKVEKIRKNRQSSGGATIEETIQREVVSVVLQGVSTIKRASFQKDDMYIVYVLVEMKKK